MPTREEKNVGQQVIDEDRKKAVGAVKVEEAEDGL